MRQAIILFFVAVNLFIMTVKSANSNGSSLPLITKAVLTNNQGNGTAIINNNSTVETEDDPNEEQVESESESQESETEDDPNEEKVESESGSQESETEEITLDEPEMPLE